MKYVINREFDRIDNEKKTILFTGVVENVYILNEIETRIWSLFDCACSINEAYEKFDTENSNIVVKKEDFLDFVGQLIFRNIIILSND